MGALTEYLLERKESEVHVMEIDRDSIAFLKEHFPILENRIYESDFLHTKFETVFGDEPFAVVGNGTCEILSGGKLIIGNLEGVNLVDPKGAILTSNRLFHSEISLEYNGISFQKTGDACKYVSNLILNNSLGLEFTKDMTILNDGTLTLQKGFHDLNGKTLTLGNSVATNNLIYVDGGLYSKNNLGVFKRYFPSLILSGSTDNNYGFFPFAKSAGQMGFIKFYSSDSIKSGVLSISPIFEKDSEIYCNVKDSTKTIYKIQKAFSYPS
jgi:hypothetical protein